MLPAISNLSFLSSMYFLAPSNDVLEVNGSCEIRHDLQATGQDVGLGPRERITLTLAIRTERYVISSQDL